MLASAPAGHKPPEVDSGHWYDRNGKPCYQQTTGKGGVRATDLRDGRKLGLVPSVTTVLSVLAKPALTTWMVNQGIMAALTLPRVEGESESELLARILADSREQAKAAAEEGTRVHDACECGFKGMPFPERYRPHVAAVQAEVARLFPGVTDWIAEASFAHVSGFGGKVAAFICLGIILLVVSFMYNKLKVLLQDETKAYDPSPSPDRSNEPGGIPPPIQ